MKPITGWILTSKDEDGKWYICWHEVFETRKRALELAVSWPKPWKAVRGQLVTK